nr:hypothetical protein CFP56_21748 [Quercus suber]
MLTCVNAAIRTGGTERRTWRLYNEPPSASITASPKRSGPAEHGRHFLHIWSVIGSIRPGHPAVPTNTRIVLASLVGQGVRCFVGDSRLSCCQRLPVSYSSSSLPCRLSQGDLGANERVGVRSIGEGCKTCLACDPCTVRGEWSLSWTTNGTAVCPVKPV